MSDSDSDNDFTPDRDEGDGRWANQTELLAERSPGPRHQMYMNLIAHDSLAVDLYIAAINGSAEAQRQVLLDAQRRLPAVRAVNAMKFDGMFGGPAFSKVRSEIADRPGGNYGLVTASTLAKFRGFVERKRKSSDPPVFLERDRRPYEGPSKPRGPKPR